MSSSNEKDGEGNVTLNERWQLTGRSGSVSIGQTRPRPQEVLRCAFIVERSGLANCFAVLLFCCDFILFYSVSLVPHALLVSLYIMIMNVYVRLSHIIKITYLLPYLFLHGHHQRVYPTSAV